MTTALAMISGGLDSSLAAKLIKDQGIKVIGICFKSYFFGPRHALMMAKQIDIPLVVVDFSKEHLEMVKKPKHGYGKNMNPCIDCHAMMMNYSGKLLQEYDADFIITGEVLNQRPMSQNKSSLDVVIRESGYSDKILRPLCALNLRATKMELEGLVDRSKLMGISGRSRRIQMELAEKWGIADYPSPAGGCKLTDPNFSKRLCDLFKHEEILSEERINLLSFGRHIRVSTNAKIISTRTAEEMNEIKNYVSESDLVFLAKDYKGSMIIITGNPGPEEIKFAARLAGRYSKGKDQEEVSVIYGYYGHPLNMIISVVPVKDDEIKLHLI
ncbi:MAG: tRNA 4-thiouridine(8) synthase ThiI [Syntrophomonas sp.]|nr:tRNA 4-thiouridine(8) synthase ThiI [Syntrophomonas sp.]